jgi:CRISPR-associated protein Cmr5
MSGPKTLDQQRAEHAWKVVEKVRGNKQSNWDQFQTQAKKLPTRIMAAGLGQALAFLLPRNETKELQEALSSWLVHRRPLKAGEDDRLVVRLLHGDADFQRYATEECLAYLVWLVRFADAAGVTAG